MVDHAKRNLLAAEIVTSGNWKEAEAIQMDFCRRILRCSSKTSKLAMRELGLWSLQARRDLKMLVWWFKVVNMDNSRLIKQVYNTGKQLHISTKKANWTSTAKSA